MVVGEANINNIMGGIENTGSVRLHNHKRKLKQRFDIIKKLGQGTYGKVQLGINKETGQEVAIKTIKKSKIDTEADLIRIRREIQIMSSVQHPNIIHIYEVFENREKMVLVMEYAAGGELYDYLSERKVLVEEEARRIFRQISTACYYCHKHKICHRDLKLENILLDENRNAKIADFGLSNVFDDQRLLSTFCGSPLYASPEIVKGTPYHGPEVDCWSLGVLLYTLVYGAMPFDGSNFKRLVKQISQGDYFEPKNPSPASPLIQEMLTVNPKHRANIEKICAHWWVNEGYEESCLEISEELANQTPVRLDVLLSLNPPPSQIESDKLVLTGEANDQMKAEPVAPTRSQSVGSLMEIVNPSEKRIKDLIVQESKVTPKRKLETTVSSDQANIGKDGKRKEKIVKEHTVADISVSGQDCTPEVEQDVKMSDELPVDNDEGVKEEEIIDESLLGAVCAEIIEENKKSENKKPQKVRKTLTSFVSNDVLEKVNENPSQESLHSRTTQDNNKENTVPLPTPIPDTAKVEVQEEKAPKEVKTPVKKLVKKKVVAKKETKDEPKKAEVKEEAKEIPAEPPAKPVERRQSRIFEQAEKFQNMISSGDNKAQSPEKPKKIIIPGVSVGGFKKEFERKASLKSVSPPKLKSTTSKKHIIDEKPNSISNEAETKTTTENLGKETEVKTEANGVRKTETPEVNLKNEPSVKEPPEEDEHRKKLKNAVSIISNALDKEGTRKSKSRPCMTRKPPVPFGSSGRSASGSIAMISPLSPPDNKRVLKMQTSLPSNKSTMPVGSTAEQVISEPEPLSPPENKTSSAEITLKSATLPRRKSTKAEIQLEYPNPKPATIEFKTEMSHPIQAPPVLTTQRSEVMFPVNTPPQVIGLRSSSLEPDTRTIPKERIIPIAFESPSGSAKEPIQSPPTKPPMPRMFSTQKSSQRANSLSRQSTEESDKEGSVSGEPIKKSPREYIIPIAVEGGGYVTPRAGSLEPSDTSSNVTNASSRKTSSSKLGRPRRMMSLFDRDGSEDESPFGTIHRHSSFGRDSDTEGDSRKDAFHLHRLRSSRPRKATLEHNDSLSSGEDDDDEDGFEFLTAENLFSTLLSRVRDLTHGYNDDGTRTAFPKSRLLGQSKFWNRMEPLTSARNSPLGRQYSREHRVNSSMGVPWRRSVSRDLASDIDNVFNDTKRTPLHSATLPRGDNTDTKERLNLSDLNLKKLKLTEEDALALSYLTPGLSRRIQKQLFASLPPSEARKISRTLSMRNDNDKQEHTFDRRSVDRISSTLPRKFSYDKSSSSQQNLTCDINQNNHLYNENESISNCANREDKSFLPVKSSVRDIISPYSDRSTRSERDSRCSSEHPRPKSRYLRGTSLREPADFKSKMHTYSLRSPDSSISEISSIRDEDSFSNGPESTSFNKYLHSNSLIESKKSEETKIDGKPRKVSRFLRTDFYETPKEENVVVKEKKEREMETQKVLKEIRDKRIRNRLTLRRERSLSRDKFVNIPSDNTTDIGKNSDKVETVSNIEAVDDSKEQNTVKCKELVKALIENNIESNNTKETENFLKNVSDNIRNLESNAILNKQNSREGIVNKKEQRVSKLVRPKSYPTESTVNGERDTKTKTTDSKGKVAKLKKGSAIAQKSKEKETKEDKPTKSKFLQSIEKKIEKLRTFNSDDKVKDDKKSGVETTIKRLREQSVPRSVDHITESTLIKRAVSVEDFSNVKNKTLQPSRKSVTKILSLFKKYEEKDKAKEEESQLKNNPDPSVMLKNITESSIPMFKSKIPSSQEKSPEKTISNERPKSLSLDKSKRCNGTKSDKGGKLNSTSKLPVNSFRKSANLEECTVADDTGNNVDNCNYQKKEVNRKNLKLDFSNLNESTQDVNLNRISYTTDESSALMSPCDETLSCDSWSVCSDFHHTQDLVSPISPNGNIYNSGDENESVIDRIRRRSFYTRFNEKKKPRKCLMGNYKDLDLYKDYNQKSVQKYKTPNDYSGPLYRKSSGYSSSGEGEYDYKRYGRSKSVANDYVNLPRYQTFNPRRSNIASLYLSMSEDNNTEDMPTAGTYTKYSYTPNTSRLSTYSRPGRSPNSDFQYTHHYPHTSTSQHSSIISPKETNKKITEHAV